MTLSVEAERATLGALTIEKLNGRAHITPEAITVEPIGFGLFGGRSKGTLALRVGDSASTFRWTATLSVVDVAAATAFIDSPLMVTGRLSGKIDLTGTAADPAMAIRTARGTARIDVIDVIDGVVKKLGFARAVVTATSMRSGAATSAASGSVDEPFSRLGATVVVANGAATTKDLRFESANLIIDAAGTAKLDGSAVNLSGRVQLSEELTRQAGSDLARYTQERGRITFPATVSGSAGALSVRLDASSMVKRPAPTNRAKEEAQKQLKSDLGGLLKRP